MVGPVINDAMFARFLGLRTWSSTGSSAGQETLPVEHLAFAWGNYRCWAAGKALSPCSRDISGSKRILEYEAVVRCISIVVIGLPLRSVSLTAKPPVRYSAGKAQSVLEELSTGPLIGNLSSSKVLKKTRVYRMSSGQVV